MRKTYYKKGDYNVICDRSGYKVKATECRRTWDGLFVRKIDWEPRHPQDFVRGKKDNQRVPYARTENTDSFLSTNEVTSDDL